MANSTTVRKQENSQAPPALSQIKKNGEYTSQTKSYTNIHTTLRSFSVHHEKKGQWDNERLKWGM